jgi:hypothetical protein
MNQSNLPFAEGATSARIQHAMEGAEHESPGWTEDAAAALRSHARTVESFIVEDVRGAVPATSEPRAWGAATRVARARGWIESAGFRTDQWGSPKTVWRRGPNA